MDYSLYQSLEDRSINFKTWLLKLIRCPVGYVADKKPADAHPTTMNCMVLMVWEPGLGFKEVVGGGIIAPQSNAIGAMQELGLAGNLPVGFIVAMAFTQPHPPIGPTFLRVDFWNDIYLGEEFSKLAIISVHDSTLPTKGILRTISSWKRNGGGWYSEGSLSGPKDQDVDIPVKEILRYPLMTPEIRPVVKQCGLLE